MLIKKNEEKSIDEIKKMKKNLLSLLKEQFKLRMQKKIGQVNKIHLFKKIRRNIARLKTKINENKE